MGLLNILPGWAMQIIFLGPRPRTTKLSDNAEIKLANPGKPENETQQKMIKIFHHSGPEYLKKVQAKNSSNEMNQFHGFFFFAYLPFYGR